MESLNNTLHEEVRQILQRRSQEPPTRAKEKVCPYCQGSGYIYMMSPDGYEYAEPCSCEITRRQCDRLERSGLVDVREQTLERFGTSKTWQAALKGAAKRYLQDEGSPDIGKPWFFIGGQVGSGKTHLCTGICLELIKQGETVRYEIWAKLLGDLTAIRNTEEYVLEMQTLQEVQTLYIDDFFRRTNITAGEREKAWEILNARYLNGKRTIISSERRLNWIVEIDEAIGSRIYQRAGEYNLNVRYDQGKNQRTLEEKEV